MVRKARAAERTPLETRGKASPGLGLADWPDIMTLVEAGAKVNMHPDVLRQAVRRGDLDAFIPRGVHPGHTGPGQGYRVTRAALEAWYFNKPREA